MKLFGSHSLTLGVFVMAVLMPGADLLAGGLGSGYSRFGVGEIRYGFGERSFAMGGSGLAAPGTSSINTLNPATWTSLNRMRFSVGLSYDGYTLEDGRSSTFLSSARFNGFVFGIPLSTEHGLTVSMGLVPYSVVNFDVVSNRTEGGYDYSLHEVGNGGLTSAYLGISAIAGNDWHLGIKYSYLFGSLEHITNQTFASSSLTNTRITRTNELSGSTVTLGLVYSGLGTILNISGANNLSAGVVFSTGTRLTTTSENLYEYSAGGSVIGRDTIPVAEGRSQLPLMFGGGLSYVHGDHYLVAADLLYQNWNRFTLLDVHPTELRDSYRISVGGEFLPRKEVSAGYWDRTAYRFGIFYDATNLRIGTTGINEYGVTTGVGMPVFGETRFNIGVQYSIRGTTAIERDKIIRVTLTLNSGELWFVRPPEE